MRNAGGIRNGDLMHDGAVHKHERDDPLVTGFTPPQLNVHLLVVAGMLGYDKDSLSYPVEIPLVTIFHLPLPELKGSLHVFGR